MKPTIKPPKNDIDIQHYRTAAEHANDIFLQHQQENTMNPIIASPKTSLAGIVAAAPLFIIGVGALIAGDIGSGVGNIIAALGILFGLLQAQDAGKVADVVKQIIPKPQSGESVTSNSVGLTINAGNPTE
jgi:predicted Fe-Mo cluster-binding NifX family protein